MDDVIFVREGGALRAIGRQSYEREVDLQVLLAKHPELLMLSGEQMRPGDAIRWLLVCREAGISDREDGANRWSVDHLLIDQERVPTFVEVKRSADTRIRREVVGQMLEYAANATAHWPVHNLRDLARAEAGSDEELASRWRN